MFEFRTIAFTLAVTVATLSACTERNPSYVTETDSGTTCVNPCVVGKTTCQGNNLRLCQQQQDCPRWSKPEPCPLDEPFCSDGRCAAQCVHECEPGTQRCAGDGTQRCGEASPESCRLWEPAVSCGQGEICAAGVCVPNPCQDRQCGTFLGVQCGSCETDQLCDSGGNCVARCVGAACETCGNGVCDNAETSSTCPSDCAVELCGNSICDPNEDLSTCPVDCTCGNGFCDQGETLSTCPMDCTCGNGICEAAESTATCPADCTCGNGICEAAETALRCPADCVPKTCGDRHCELGETLENCPKDCPPGTCPENASRCTDVDHMATCVDSRWVKEDCLTFCQADGTFPLTCTTSPSTGQGGCQCASKGQYGSPCELADPSCAYPLWCVNQSKLPSENGVCTMQCRPVGSRCTDVPRGKVATCSNRMISNRTFCSFICSKGVPCPLSMTCPPGGGPCEIP